MTSIRDADAILGLIVDETRRVLGSDGAHLTRMSDDRTYLRPMVVAGGTDDETRDWLRSQEFPIDGGINGLAAGQGRVVWTPSYATDPRIPREADDLDVADRMGLGAMAAAPLRAPGGDVIGTLAVSYAQPGSIPADRLATLQALADHAAIALSNSDLLERVEASEANYRGLVQTTPDVIWRNDADGRFTFLADTAEDLFGWTAGRDDRHALLVDRRRGVDGHGAAVLGRPPRSRTSSLRLRFVVRRKDGSTFPTELSAVGIFEDGEFKGAQGTVRDVSERERLERIVHESEERYRSLVQSSPDLIFEMDGHGIYTFYSDRTEDVIGWLPGELIGHSFTEFIDIAAFPQAPQRLAEIAANPGRPSTDRLLLRHKDGRKIPFEVSVVGQVDDKGELDRDPRRRPRHQRARAPRARAAVVRGALPVPRRQRARHRVLGRPADALHLSLGHDRAADRLAARRAGGGDVRPARLARRRCTSRPSAGSASPATRRSRRSCASSSCARTAARCRSRSTRSRRSTGRATSPASTAPRATSASASASSASCAIPRSATATSSSRRPTSSG